ncbi:MAG: alkaline phosphatase family protein [Myxococcota bacterium]|nr:alkaline phosphatase family protein [Myxococcota bacterium]
MPGPKARASNGKARRGRRTLGRLLLAVLAGCGGPSQETPQRGRVLLVGIDGASPRVVEPMAAEGRLPSLAALARDGVSGRIRSFLPLYSPRVWTTVATGKTPRKHGIRGFVAEQEDGSRRIYQSSDRVAHALWNIASDAGLTVGVVNWWTTQPPERVRGVMVTDHLFPEVRDERSEFMRAAIEHDTPAVHPVEWLPRVQRVVAAEDHLTEVGDLFAGADGLPDWVNRDFLSRRFRFDETVTRIALDIESELRPDLLMVLLPGIDKVSHFLWGALEPDEASPPGLRFPPEQKALAAETLRLFYVYTDALVGRLVERYGPQDLVIVLSDHGFHAGGALGRLTGLHKDRRASEAVFFARGRGLPAGGDAGAITVNDVTPTVLVWLGLPVGRDMDGSPAAFLGERTVEQIASYDTKPIERVGSTAPEVEEALVEELEALGYLEPATRDEAPDSGPKP